MGPEPPYGAGPGQFPAQGRANDHWEESKEVGGGGGGWEYPPLAAAMEGAGFEDIGVCIKKRQNTVAQYIVTRPILDLCEQSIQRL